MRHAIDTSPEPVTNGAANVGEAGVMAALLLLVWQHPWLSLGAALLLLAVLMTLVVVLWRTFRRATMRLRPGRPTGG